MNFKGALLRFVIAAVFVHGVMIGCGDSGTCTLTIAMNPEGAGTVLCNPNRTNFAPGKKVTITAAPAVGYTFFNWTATDDQTQFADANSAVTTTIMKANSNTTVIANFRQVCTLTVSQNLASGGTVTPAPQQAGIVAETPVNITADPVPGYIFRVWIVSNGQAHFADARNAATTVTLSSNATITANFYTGFTDSRTGQGYRTARIGNRTWMTENLNFKIANSWCYNDNENNCQRYGRLYDWHTALKACPSGWRLPARQDWNNLVQAAGGNVAGTKLKSTTGWNYNGNGTDEFGFSALPGGGRNTGGGFGYIGTDGRWWSATESGGGSAWYRYMSSSSDYMGEAQYEKGRGFSALCVRD